MAQLSFTGDTFLLLLLPTLILLHVVLSPYTKVEESFTLQATHDILIYGIPTEDIGTYLRTNYDHFSFPGAVPRTFTGALVLAAASKPAIAMGIDRQIAARGTLGLLNAFALLAFRGAIVRSFGRGTANWFLLFQASQFHIIYYASRTLPNMLAFGLTTLAMANMLPLSSSATQLSTLNLKRYRLTIYLLTMTAVVFRCEIAILLTTVILHQFARRGLRDLWRDTFAAGLTGGLIGLILTISIDSFFWQRFPLWPELSGFYYNAIQNQAINWGTSPWHYYLTNTLPRLLLNPLTWQLCMPMAVGIHATRKPSLDILLPLLAFVGIYSLQPHKEWRFIVYVVPGLTAVSGLGAHWIWTRRDKTMIYRFLSLALIASILASFGISFLMLVISRLNYPGAEALQRVHDLGRGRVHDARALRIHSDTLSCTTGITRFLEKKLPPATPLLFPSSSSSSSSTIRHNNNKNETIWLYSKEEDPKKLADPTFWEYFDYALAEHPESVLQHARHDGSNWEVVDVVRGFTGVKIVQPRDVPSSSEDGDAGDSEESRSLRQEGKRMNDDGDDDGLSKNVWRSWKRIEGWMKTYVTRGWWVEIQMDPKIYILRRRSV